MYIELKHHFESTLLSYKLSGESMALIDKWVRKNENENHILKKAHYSVWETSPR